MQELEKALAETRKDFARLQDHALSLEEPAARCERLEKLVGEAKDELGYILEAPTLALCKTSNGERIYRELVAALAPAAERK